MKIIEVQVWQYVSSISYLKGVPILCHHKLAESITKKCNDRI